MPNNRFTKKHSFRFLLRIPVPWVYILTYLAGAAIDYATGPHFFIKRVPRLGIAGALVFAVGAAIAGWGWLTFRKARTTTVPVKYRLGSLPGGPIVSHEILCM